MLHSLLSKLTRCLRTLFRLVVHKKGKRRIKKNGIVLFGSHHIFQIGLRRCFTSSVNSLPSDVFCNERINKELN